MGAEPHGPAPLGRTHRPRRIGLAARVFLLLVLGWAARVFLLVLGSAARVLLLLVLGWVAPLFLRHRVGLGRNPPPPSLRVGFGLQPSSTPSSCCLLGALHPYSNRDGLSPPSSWFPLNSAVVVVVDSAGFDVVDSASFVVVDSAAVVVDCRLARSPLRLLLALLVLSLVFLRVVSVSLVFLLVVLFVFLLLVLFVFLLVASLVFLVVSLVLRSLVLRSLVLLSLVLLLLFPVLPLLLVVSSVSHLIVASSGPCFILVAGRGVSAG